MDQKHKQQQQHQQQHQQELETADAIPRQQQRQRDQSPDLLQDEEDGDDDMVGFFFLVHPYQDMPHQQPPGLSEFGLKNWRKLNKDRDGIGRLPLVKPKNCCHCGVEQDWREQGMILFEKKSRNWYYQKACHGPCFKKAVNDVVCANPRERRERAI